MHLALWITGSLLAFAWFSRIVDAGLGMPSVANIADPQWSRELQVWPKVSIVVPALNEEETIFEALNRLLRLDYPNFEIIAVNDRSTDHTGALMDAVAALPEAAGRLRVVHVTELPAGWLGKVHAMQMAAATCTDSDWLLFTDADILYRPDALRRAIGYVEAESADHLVLFPNMVMKSVGEHMMIAFFQTMFVFGHRPWKVADPKAKDHIGVGAFNLIRRTTYDAIGGHQRLRMEVVDDMKLGKLVKEAGFRQHNVFGIDAKAEESSRGLISLRWAKSAMGVVNNFEKNFFAVLSYQRWRTIAALGGLLFLNLGPFVGAVLVSGWARLPFVVALLSMAAIYAGMGKHSRIPAYYILLHPVSTILIAYGLAASMFHAIRNGGIIWRGTLYPMDELRNGLV